MTRREEEPAPADAADALGEALPALSASRVTPLTSLRRYYTRLFLPDAGVRAPPAGTSACGGGGGGGGGGGVSTRGHDHYVHLQSNRVCIVGLAPAHPAVRRGAQAPAVRVDFAEPLRALAVSGKRKRGALIVEPGRELARVTLADGRSYPVRACVAARVLEVNTRLRDEPALLTELPLTLGFVAVLELQLAHVVAARATLLDEDRYARLLAARGLAPMEE